ncbi:MAG TPA: hypothetical protein VK796_06710 [Cytophaga sp.]|jgi:hypothetical protein|nr:hypothetical protein [Cytophaga sp.]
MKAKYLFLFLILSPFFSQGQNSKPILLEGTVGRASVIMELEINGTNISAQYYYKRF